MIKITKINLKKDIDIYLFNFNKLKFKYTDHTHKTLNKHIPTRKKFMFD